MSRTARRPEPRRRAGGLLGAVPVVALLLALVTMATHLTSAAFVATTSTSATLSSQSCFFRATTQSGSTTSTANGTKSVFITPVTMSRSFLLFSVRSNSDRPVGSEVRGELATSSRIDFTRVTDEGAPATISIRWYVVEYSCGVSVRRGSASLSGTTTNIAVAPVASRASAFVTVSATPASTDVIWSSNDPFVAELTSTSNLQIRTDDVADSHTVAWQVIEFTDASKIEVQRGTTWIASGSSSRGVTLPTAVDTSKAFVLATARSSPPGSDIGSSMIRARLTNSTTVTFDRSASAYGITEISYEVVELNDGTSVQSGSASFANGQSSVNAALSAVNLGHSTAFASVQIGPGQSSGRMAYTSDDIVGAGTATVTLSSATQVTLTRSSTLSSADIGWFVVSWGLAW